MGINSVPQIAPLGFFLLSIWAIFWKGLALWRAAKYDQRNWFVILLVLNFVGILEIIYLFGFAKKKMILNDLIFWKQKTK